MTESKENSYRESAMRDGTVLALLWIVTFTLSTVMLKSVNNDYSIVASLGTMALTMMSPFVVYKLSLKHRNNERNGTMTYSEAWLYIFTMYLCAIILSSIAQYIFYAYIDPDIFAGVIPEFEKLAITNGLDAGSIKIFTGTFEMLDKMSAGEIVLSQMSGHITRTIVLTSLIALAIKKKPAYK